MARHSASIAHPTHPARAALRRAQSASRARAVPAALATLAALAGLARPVTAQGVPPWRTDVAAALAEARSEHRLVLVCCNADLDGEPANHRMAHAVYRDERLLAALAGVVPVIASPDQHGESDGRCERLGCAGCAAHQTAERHARRHLFGDRRDVIAPQHVLLYPDGGVAWHALYEVSAPALARQIDAAKRTLRKSDKQQVAARVARFRSLLAGAASDPERYLVLSTTLWSAREDVFPRMLERVTDDDLAARLLRGLVALGPDRAEPRLRTLEHGCRRPLRPTVALLLAEIRAERARSADAPVADHAPDAGRGPVANDRRAADDRGEVPSDRGEVVPAALTRIGAPEAIPHVRFTDGAEHGLTGEEGKVTVLLFFLPNDAHVARQVRIWNGFVERTAGEPVAAFALGASLAPQTELARTRELGFRFPAANYLYEASIAPYGITSFPTAVVIDQGGHVVFKGDAYSVFAAVVDRALKSRER